MKNDMDMPWIHLSYEDALRFVEIKRQLVKQAQNPVAPNTAPTTPPNTAPPTTPPNTAPASTTTPAGGKEEPGFFSLENIEKLFEDPDVQAGLIGSGVGMGLGALGNMAAGDRGNHLLSDVLTGGLLSGGLAFGGSKVYNYLKNKPPTSAEFDKAQSGGISTSNANSLIRPLSTTKNEKGQHILKAPFETYVDSAGKSYEDKGSDYYQKTNDEIRAYVDDLQVAMNRLGLKGANRDKMLKVLLDYKGKLDTLNSKAPAYFLSAKNYDDLYRAQKYKEISRLADIARQKEIQKLKEEALEAYRGKPLDEYTGLTGDRNLTGSRWDALTLIPRQQYTAFATDPTQGLNLSYADILGIKNINPMSQDNFDPDVLFQTAGAATIARLFKHVGLNQAIGGADNSSWIALPTKVHDALSVTSPHRIVKATQLANAMRDPKALLEHIRESMPESKIIQDIQKNITQLRANGDQVTADRLQSLLQDDGKGNLSIEPTKLDNIRNSYMRRISDYFNNSAQTSRGFGSRFNSARVLVNPNRGINLDVPVPIEHTPDAQFAQNSDLARYTTELQRTKGFDLNEFLSQLDSSKNGPNAVRPEIKNYLQEFARVQPDKFREWVETIRAQTPIPGTQSPLLPSYKLPQLTVNEGILRNALHEVQKKNLFMPDPGESNADYLARVNAQNQYLASLQKANPSIRLSIQNGQLIDVPIDMSTDPVDKIINSNSWGIPRGPSFAGGRQEFFEALKNKFNNPRVAEEIIERLKLLPENQFRQILTKAYASQNNPTAVVTLPVSATKPTDPTALQSLTEEAIHNALISATPDFNKIFFDSLKLSAKSLNISTEQIASLEALSIKDPVKFNVTLKELMAGNPVKIPGVTPQSQPHTIRMNLGDRDFTAALAARSRAAQQNASQNMIEGKSNNLLPQPFHTAYRIASMPVRVPWWVAKKTTGSNVGALAMLSPAVYKEWISSEGFRSGVPDLAKALDQLKYLSDNGR